MKYSECDIRYRDVPNEITLTFWITGCPNHCPDCHSKDLWKDFGEDFTVENVFRETQNRLENSIPITCICFMGGDQDRAYLISVVHEVKKLLPDIKMAWYSGKDFRVKTEKPTYTSFDYIKTGPFIKERGPLNDPNTNQKFYIKDINNVFHECKFYENNN